jgi:hypothetical protein
MTLAYSDLRRNVYAISDGAIDKRMPAEPVGRPLVPGRLADSAGVMPRLHDLGGAAPRAREVALALLHAQQEEGYPAWLCALIEVDDDCRADYLVHILVERLVLVLPGVGPCLFRYFDPKVLVQLEWLLTDPQMAWLMGPVRQWKYAIDGQWRTLPRPDTLAPRGLQPTTRQAFALRHMQVLNEVLARLPPGPIADRQERGRRILDHLETAAGHGLRKLRDLQAYAWHGMTVHPRFDTHPLMQQRLQSLPLDADFPYCAAIADLTAGDYDLIREDLGLDLAVTAPSRTLP